MDSAEDRLAFIGRVLADPPPVHVGIGDPPNGLVWATDSDCYEFLADRCPPGSRTLETGLGLSTVLFAGWGCHHTCVVPNAEEVARCEAYLDERGIDRTQLRFEVGLSEDILPRLEPDPLDTVLIDGGHGFPTTLIDWFYAAGRLRQGGWLVVDDLQLPSVRLGLLDFLDADLRWRKVHRTWKWAAWSRASVGPLAEPHMAQPFLGPPAERPRRASWLPEPIRPIAKRLVKVARRRS